MAESQPGYVIKMVAKPGRGDTLFELATKYIKESGASDPWVMCAVPGEPDTMWSLELFKDEGAKSRYEGSEDADKWRDEILDLLAEPPLRVEVRPRTASWLK